jgi:hypothetical protein
MKEHLGIKNFPLNKGIGYGGTLFKSANGFVKRIPKNMIDLENSEDVRQWAEQIIHRMDDCIQELREQDVIISEDYFEMVWTYDIDNGDVLVLVRVGTLGGGNRGIMGNSDN